MIWRYWPFRALLCLMRGHDYRLVTGDSDPKYAGRRACLYCLHLADD